MLFVCLFGRSWFCLKARVCACWFVAWVVFVLCACVNASVRVLVCLTCLFTCAVVCSVKMVVCLCGRVLLCVFVYLFNHWNVWLFDCVVVC